MARVVMVEAVVADGGCIFSKQRGTQPLQHPISTESRLGRGGGNDGDDGGWVVTVLNEGRMRVITAHRIHRRTNSRTCQAAALHPGAALGAHHRSTLHHPTLPSCPCVRATRKEYSIAGGGIFI